MTIEITKLDRLELLAKLLALAASKYPEESHREADQLLVDYIDDPEIAAAFDAIGKWYA